MVKKNAKNKTVVYDKNVTKLFSAYAETWTSLLAYDNLPETQRKNDSAGFAVVD